MTRHSAFLVVALSLRTLAAQDAPQQRGFGNQGRGPMRMSPVFLALDLDGDGVISAVEIRKAPQSLQKLDKNGDGQLTADELRPNFGRGRRDEERDHTPNTSGSGDDLVQTLMAFDRNGDGKLSKDEVPERMQGLFDRGDTNHDGYLTRDEIVKLAQQQSSSASPRDGERRGPDFMQSDAIVIALDTNHDGVISATEIAGASASLLKLDKNGDGQLTPDEVRPNRGRGGDPSFMAHRMIEEFDQNGDGKLSKSEMPDRLQAMFEQIDTNKDGFVTQDELVHFMQTQGGQPGGDRGREPR